jgi:hypothetical protein
MPAPPAWATFIPIFFGFFLKKNTIKNLGEEFAKQLASAQEVASAGSAGVSGGVASSFSAGAAFPLPLPLPSSA